MRYRIFIISIALALSSCVQMNASVPTTSPAPTTLIPVALSTPTSYPSPLPTLLINPFQIPTPINTPHPVPQALNLDWTEEPGNWFDKRTKSFENTLDFNISISGVGFEIQRAESYIVYLEGTLINISDQPIVVRRTLSSGWNYQDIHWTVTYNGYVLNRPPRSGFYIQTFSITDFVVLQPNEKQKYLLGFDLPLTILDNEGREISLANKKIRIAAEYLSAHIGYRETMDSPYVDINAWVGLVESNEVECVLP